MKFENFKKMLGITAVGVGIGGAVEAQGPLKINDGDELAKIDSKKNEYKITGNEAKPVEEKARKVEKVPDGYVKDKVVGNKTYYKKITGSINEVKIATPGGPQGDNSAFLIAKLKSGVSPDELVRAGHATKDGIEKFKEYYTHSSSIDIVYTEPETKKVGKEVDPYAAYAIKGEGVYMPGVSGHNAGQMYYLTRESKNIIESGVVNTGNQKFVIRFEDGNGKPILKDSKGNPVPGGLAVEIAVEDRNKYLDESGTHLRDGAYEALMKLVEEQKKLDKTYTFEGKDFAVNK
jgi:hypothetical protein